MDAVHGWVRLFSEITHWLYSDLEMTQQCNATLNYKVLIQVGFFQMREEEEDLEDQEQE